VRLAHSHKAERQPTRVPSPDRITHRKKRYTLSQTAESPGEADDCLLKLNNTDNWTRKSRKQERHKLEAELDDLDIDMEGWSQINETESKPSSAKHLGDSRPSIIRPDHKQGPPCSGLGAQSASSFSEDDNDSVVYMGTRRKDATAGTSIVDTATTVVELYWDFTMKTSRDKWDNPTHNSISASSSEIHAGCDFALPSVEDVYARAERAKKRKGT
jgi:hypothetical protein